MLKNTLHLILILGAAFLIPACGGGGGGGGGAAPGAGSGALFVTVGDTPFADTMSSADGTVWSDFFGLPTGPTYRALTAGGGYYVTGDDDGSIYYTTDLALDWTDNVVSGQSTVFRAAAYGGGVYVVGGENGITNTVEIYRATTPGTWSLATFNSNHPDFLYDIAYGNGTFVAIGLEGIVGSIYSSTDGLTWTLEASGANIFLNSVAYDSVNNLWVVTGTSGGNFMAYRSSDFSTWPAAAMGGESSAFSIAAITYGNGQFVAVGESSGGGGYYWVSSDGINWTDGSIASMRLTDVAFAGGRFVTVGEQHSILYSTSGTSWTAAAVPGGGGWLESVVAVP